MSNSALHLLRHSLIAFTATALLAGCADEGALGPDRLPTPQIRPPELAASDADPSAAGAGHAAAHRTADLGACDNLRVPAGSRLAAHTYAQGVQIYRWNGVGWTFVAPDALLLADAAGRSTIGIHYAGPTWESVSGSKVVGAVLERCSPDPTAVPWLLLGAVSAEGPGIFQRVTFIQRVNTVGGKAPCEPGSFTGQEARVPYTTEYFFYRAQ